MYEVEEFFKTHKHMLPRDFENSFEIQGTLMIVKLPKLFWRKLETERKRSNLDLASAVSFCVCEFIARDYLKFLGMVGMVPTHNFNKED